jgi:hypothetical protein
MKNSSRMFSGIALIAIGVLFFLKVLGVINFSVWEGYKTYWPIGLILVGLALIFRAKWLAFVFLFLTVLSGGLYVLGSVEVGELREVVKGVPFEDGITTLDLRIGFGAGDMKIGDGSSEYLVRHEVKTSSSIDPEVRIEKSGENAEVSIERRGEGFAFWNQIKDDWNIEISSDVEVNLDLDYGAADATVDLENLKVRELDIDSGATSTEIIFGRFPTKVDIDTGASSLNLKFPEGMGVVIEVDGGAVSTNLDGFIKKDGKYYSEKYDENEGNIEVDIDAGASSIEGEFY